MEDDPVISRIQYSHPVKLEVVMRVFRSILLVSPIAALISVTADWPRLRGPSVDGRIFAGDGLSVHQPARLPEAPSKTN
jgi:hypothetical protein